MVHIDFDQFDDELQSLLSLMNDGEIALHDDVLKVPIKILYLKRAVTVNRGISLKDAIDTLLARNIGSVLVVENNEIYGILTERDLLLKVAGQNLDIENEKIDDYMSTNTAVIKESDSVEVALRYMDEKGYRHIGVINEQALPVAVISIRDIIGYLVEFFPNDVLNLPPHQIRMGSKERFGA